MSDSTPEALVDDQDLTRFPCPACGGEVAFDPTEQKLRCKHCDSLSPLPAAPGAIEELGLRDARAQGQGKGMGVSRKSLRCESCGAITSFDDTNRSVKCAFCDSSHVIQESESDPDVIRPASLIPFQVPRDAALNHFDTWLKGLWFKPGDLVKSRRLKEIRGVYLPFWTFDAQTDARWTAQAGYHYYVTETYTEMVNGKPQVRTRQVQHTRWEHASGYDSHFFDDELVVASRGLKPGMVRKVYPFDTSALQIYQPPFLAGWEAERYQIDLEEGWGIGRRLIEGHVRSRCAAQVPGDTHRNLQVSTQFSRVTFKHVLLPMWIAAYHYKQTLYQVLINGQSGKVSGKAPRSWIKITLFILTLILIVTGIALAVQHAQ